MKLRTKFIVLIFGIVVFPFIVSALVFLIQVVRSGKELPANNLANLENWFSKKESRSKLEEMIDSFMQKKTKGIEILVINNRNEVLKSTFSDLDASVSIGQERLLNYIREKGADFHFLMNVFPVLDTNNTVILKIKKIDSLQEKIHMRIVFALEVVIIIFLAAALYSILIIRSFTLSILNLKTATKKIAGGDLDFVLKIRGKDEIADLTRAFDNMRRALKEEYERRARFLMGVSHDLKTPLAVIVGYVEAIQDGHAGNAEKLKHFLAIIQDKSRLLERRISDLIEYVKMATGEWKMNHKDIPLAAFLSQIAGHYEKDARVLKRKFDYAINLPETLVVRMDERLIERVLENIIANAIRYTKETDEIAFTAGVSANRILITISDTGPGIAQEELGNIFDPFYRGSNSRQEPGLGLGLSTVRSIIAAHGWKIDVDSTPGKGTSFRIEIDQTT